MSKLVIKSKPTIASVKSLIKNHPDKLLFRSKRSFDGMIDGARYNSDKSYRPLLETKLDNNKLEKYNLGYCGVYFVSGGSKNYVNVIDNDEVIGYNVYNCCDSFDVVISKKDNNVELN